MQLNQELTTQFFTKTQNLLDSLSTLSIFNKDILQKGIRFDSKYGFKHDGRLGDSKKSDKNGVEQSLDSIFFTFFVGSELYLAVAYSYIFDERMFLKEESPRLHFIKCPSFKQLQENSEENIKICVPSINAFDYRVRVNNSVDTRLFYEHPLHLCYMCLSLLGKILNKKYKKEFQIKEQEVMSLILKNKLKNIVG